MSTSNKLTFEESYLGQLRKLVGSRSLICPAARAIMTSTDETTHARFFAPDDLPKDLHPLYKETLADLERYGQTGQFILK